MPNCKQHPRRYHVGDVRCPELEWDERYSRRMGIIHIGGDLGDVEADLEPTVEDDMITLHNVDLVTSLRRNLCPASQYELAQEIIYTAYESIGTECFAPSKER